MGLLGGNMKKNKELFWLFDQDGAIGICNSRREFDALWDKGEYDIGACMYLDMKYLKFID